jgi:hypothetical protein
MPSTTCRYRSALPKCSGMPVTGQRDHHTVR